MTHPNSLPEAEGIAYKAETAAKLVDMSVSAIRNEIKANNLPAFKVGKSVRIYREHLIDWLLSKPAA